MNQLKHNINSHHLNIQDILQGKNSVIDILEVISLSRQRLNITYYNSVYFIT